MSLKQIVLIFARYYLPGYKAGGPIRSIANLVDALGDEFDFRIVTSDRDATDVEPYPGLDAPGEWKSVGKAQVLYLPPDGMGLFRIAGILREVRHDILYLNSFFDPVFTIRPLVARRLGMAPKTRCVIAPRGEFSLGALDIKTWKKRPFLLVAKVVGLYRGLTWHASSEHEEADIRRVMKAGARNIHIAMNVPAASTQVNSDRYKPRADGGPLRVCFLSRISPMKNLHFALEVLAKVPGRVRFDIYGLIDGEAYWSRCRDIIELLPENIHVCYRGIVPHDQVAETLERYELFFLPTLGENYGHAIFEALSVGTPVLIADTTPWRDLERDGVGWDLPLSDIQRFVERMEWISRIGRDRYMEMRKSAKRFAETVTNGSKCFDDNRTLFNS